MPPTQSVIEDQINRYFRARYGKDYVYRAPETYPSLLEQWMLAIASENYEWSGKIISRVEKLYAEEKRSLADG